MEPQSFRDSVLSHCKTQKEAETPESWLLEPKFHVTPCRNDDGKSSIHFRTGPGKREGLVLTRISLHMCTLLCFYIFWFSEYYSAHWKSVKQLFGVESPRFSYIYNALGNRAENLTYVYFKPRHLNHRKHGPASLNTHRWCHGDDNLQIASNPIMASKPRITPHVTAKLLISPFSCMQRTASFPVLRLGERTATN